MTRDIAAVELSDSDFVKNCRRGEIEGKVRKVLEGLKRDPGKEVAITYLKIVSVRKIIARLKKDFPDTGVSERDGIPYIFIHGYKVPSKEGGFRIIPMSLMPRVLSFIKEQLNGFTENQRMVIETRFALSGGEQLSAKETADKLGISSVRVKQICERVLGSLGFESRWFVK